MINRSKCNACKLSNFGEVKAHVCTGEIPFYITVRRLTAPPPINKRNYAFLTVFYVLFNIRYVNTE